MDKQDFFEKREEYLNDARGGGPSSCCGAGTFNDTMICESCKEHCGIDEDAIVTMLNEKNENVL